MGASTKVIRGVVPVAAALIAAGLMSPVAWANPAAARPAPAAQRNAPPPGPIVQDECTRQGGRPVPDPRNPRVRHCQGGPLNGHEVR